MATGEIEQEVHSILVFRDLEIDAPIDIAFEAMLEEIGPAGEMMDGHPFPMVVEPWPGGRWFRDLGDGAGHLWGHVQVIKPPTLLELCGPMFMSFPAMNHIQYRFTAEGDGCRLRFTHHGVGAIPEHIRANVDRGWDHRVGRIVEAASRLAASRRGAAG